MPKRRQRLFLAGLVLLAALVGAVSFAYFQYDPDPVGPGGFRRLHEGMTWDEVEAVLGKPAPAAEVCVGDAVVFYESSSSWGTCAPARGAGVYHEIFCGQSWSGPVYSIDVRVGRNGRVDGAALYRRSAAALTVWERITTWTEDNLGVRI